MITARSPLIVAVLFVACINFVRAQSERPRHGIWMGGGLGYGSAGFSCDTGCHSSRLGGVSAYLDLGWALSPHVLVGVEGHSWLHGLSSGKLPGITTASLLLSYYPRIRGGPFYEGGLGLSDFTLGQGTGDPLEPLSHDTTYYSGTGWGLALGFGWEVPGKNIRFTPRVTYAYGNVGKLDAPDATPVAKGWKQNMFTVEVGFRAP